MLDTCSLLGVSPSLATVVTVDNGWPSDPVVVCVLTVGESPCWQREKNVVITTNDGEFLQI